ncbi:MAG: RHS repeat-associated core domain-containing protein [Lentisphaerae bacterium]|nr:RHS repeat-associated core domain-containing protein [Lentisphaerota bacterium]
MRRRLLCAALFAWMTSTLLPLAAWAGGEAYIPAYNTLIHMARERCDAVGVSTIHLDLKDAASTVAGENSVTQGDLEDIRTALGAAAPYFAAPPDISNFDDPTFEDAFPVGGPALLEGIGNGSALTAVPAQYTSNDSTVYTVFTGVPLLWIHFEEIYQLILKMRFTRHSATWKSKEEDNHTDTEDVTGALDQSWSSLRDDIDALTPTPDSYNYAPISFTACTRVVPWPQFTARRLIRYAYALADVPDLGCSRRVTFYGYWITPPLSAVKQSWAGSTLNSVYDDGGTGAEEGRWHAFSSMEAMETNAYSAALGEDAEVAWLGSDPNYIKYWRGYMINGCGALVEWAFTARYISNPALDDWRHDGLVNWEDCDDCSSGCPPGGDATWRSMAANPQVTLPLGASSGTTNGGLRLKAYVTEPQVPSSVHQMFSLDTHADSTSGSTWEFMAVQRPSGAELVFALSGTSSGQVVNASLPFQAAKTNSAYEVSFGDSHQTVHRFNGSGDLVQVRSRSKEGGQIIVNGPSWPGLTIKRNLDDIVTNVVSSGMYSYCTTSGMLITHVDYKDALGNQLRSLDAHQGSRIFREFDRDDNLVGETWIKTNAVGYEIWEDVVTNGTTSSAFKTIRRESLNVTNRVLTITETRILDPDGSNPQSNLTVSVMSPFDWGDELTSRTTGYGDVAAQSTTWSYYTNSAETDLYGRLKLEEHPDGAWVRHDEYDSQGRSTIVVRPFKDAVSSVSTSLCHVTRYYYAGDAVLTSLAFPADDLSLFNDRRPRLTTEHIMGQEISRTYHAYMAGSNCVQRCAVPGASYGATSNLTTLTHLYTDGMFQGRPSSRALPDGTLSVFSYAYDSGTDQLTAINRIGAGTGSTVTNGTEMVTVFDGAERVLSRTETDISSGLLFHQLQYTRDLFGRTTSISNVLTGTWTTNQYDCCGIELTTDEEGITTSYTYGNLHRLAGSVRLGVTNEWQYDVLGNIIADDRSAGEKTYSSYNTYDAAGRLSASTNESVHATYYAYSINAAGGRLVTTTNPDSSTRIESYYRDGRLASVSGTGTSPLYMDYGVDSEGPFTIEYQGSDANAAEWVKSYNNLLGQPVKSVYPGSYSRTTTYDAAGRPTVHSDGLTTTLTAYDNTGAAFRHAMDMDSDLTIDLGETDHVTETVTGYISVGPDTLRETVTRVYPTNNSSVTYVVSTAHMDVDGSGNQTVQYGRTNSTSITRDRPTASRILTVSRPDGTQTLSHYTNGLLYTVTKKDATGGILSSVIRSYDSFNRLDTEIRTAANGDLHTTTYTYDAAGAATNVAVIVGALSQVTSYEYDSMGRRTKTILPDGAEVSYAYNSKGEMTQQSGGRSYPTSYTYTEQGRLATLSTYRGGLGGSADTTTWHYDSQRGWLISKEFANATSNTYQYYGNGALAKRTWARGTYADYVYDAGGAVTNVGYSDSTTGIGYMRDRLGRPTQITDAIGTWLQTYEADGRIAEIDLPQLTGHTLQYANDPFGRGATNISLQASGPSDPVAESRYTFDVAGRLSSVSDGNDVATYTYGQDGQTATGVSVGGVLTVIKTQDGLGRVTQISNAPTNASPVSHTYTYNSANQRTKNTLADASYWAYTYDDLGQVTGGKHYIASGAEVGGQQWEYTFDQAGNRTSARNVRGISTEAQSYTANALNQYTQHSLPGELFVTGEADANAVVSIREGTNTAGLANRQGDYFWKALAIDNTSDLFGSTNVEVRAYITQVEGTNTNSLVRLEVKNALMPQTPESPVYDTDGNLVSDGLWTNTWDGENRLVASETLAAVPDALKVRIQSEYDYLGRRTRKTVQRDYTGGSYTTTNVTTFVYDGWLLVSEQSACGGDLSTNHYVWGLDLSGSLQGAGGVGGLLMVRVAGTNYFPVYNGNGDVMGLVDTAGDIAAKYEYAPFGNIIRQSGDAADDNPFRFSTKYTDDETGLVYYGYRYYSPELGRWLNRDLIGERGGLNLYAFLGNAAVTSVDPFGLRDYRIGSTDPSLSFDAGAGAHGGDIPSLFDPLAAEMILTGAEGIFSQWPDALAHLQHYFGNSGGAYTIRLQQMINDVTEAKDLFNEEMALAQAFVEGLQKGEHRITSGTASTANNDGNDNWFYAVGGYSAWGKGTAYVCRNKEWQYILVFQYKFSDKYNWDTGKTVDIHGLEVTDEFMGRFHRVGLAQEFDMTGEVFKTIRWNSGEAPEIVEGSHPPSGRR